MGLKEREPGCAEKRSGKITEWNLSNQQKDGIFQGCFDSSKKTLPQGSMLFKKLLPPIESINGNSIDITNGLYRPNPESVFRQDPKNEEKTVPAIRNDRIRQHRMS